MSIRIPTLGPQQQIRNIPTQAPQAPVSGGASAQAIAQLGGQMAGFANELLKRRRQSDSLNFQSKSRADFLKSLHEVSRDASERFDPNDPESSIVSPVREKMQRHLDKVLQKAPDSETADAFKRTAEDILSRFEIDADQKEHERRLQVGISNYDESIQTSGKGIVLNPDEKSAMESLNDLEEVAGLQVAGGVWAKDFAQRKVESARSTLATSLLLGFSRKGDANAYSRGLAFLNGDSELLKGLKPEEVARFGAQFQKGLKAAQAQEANVFLSQFNTLTDQLGKGLLDPSEPSTRSLLERMESSIRNSEGMSDFVRAQRLAQLNLTKRASEIFHANKYTNFSASDIQAFDNLRDKSASEIRQALAGTAFEDLADLSANDLQNLADTLQGNFTKALQSRYQDGAGYSLGGLPQENREQAQQGLLGLLEIPSSAADRASIAENFQAYSEAVYQFQRGLGLEESTQRNIVPDNFAKAIAQNLENMSSPQVASRYLEHIRNSTGKNFNSVLHDVINRGGLPDQYRVLSFVDSSDSRAMERVLEGINSGAEIRESFKAKFGQDGSLDRILGGPLGGRMRGPLQRMEDDLSDLFNRGRFVGSDLTHRQVSDVIRNMTMAHMNRGVPPEQALDSARKSVFPGEIYSDRGAAVYIPKTYTDTDAATGAVVERPVDVAAVKDLMSFSVKDPFTFFTELGVDIPLAEQERLGLLKMPFVEKMNSFYQDLGRKGQWVMNEKMDGLVLQMEDDNPENLGFPVTVQNFKGGPIQVKFSEISEGNLPTFGPQIIDEAMNVILSQEVPSKKRRQAPGETRLRTPTPEERARSLDRFLSETDSPRRSFQQLLRIELTPEERAKVLESVYSKYRKNFEGADGRSETD